MKKQAYIVYDFAVEEFAASLAAKWQKDGYCEVKDKMGIVATEGDKSLATVQAICSWLLQNGAPRSATLVAVGGGVTTDIVGLAGALYKRGIAVENVPTTLLAQVDAAIGGKTGANLDGVKNAIGAIKLPEKVHLLPEPLKTLPARDLKSGAAELIKTFALFDPELYDKAVRLFSLVNGAGYTREAMDAAIPEIIELARQAAKYKEKAIKGDLFDKNKRHLLNFGHTYGHAIEWWQNVDGGHVAMGSTAADLAEKVDTTLPKTQQSSMKKITLANYSHGEAVAIGMVIAARLSEINGIADPGLAAKLAADLESCGLPTQLPTKVEDLLPAIENDKKIDGDKIDFVFLKQIGKPVLKKRRIKDLKIEG
ncbi:MAG: 3-dehydroquinate synthase [Bacteroidales bacterium]|nr:3-dehydroquinate synthase [Bacteroidales bacterium]